MVKRFTRRKKNTRTRYRNRAARTRGFVKRKRRQASKVFRRTGKVTKWMRKRKRNARIEWKKMRDYVAMDASAIYNELSSTNPTGVTGDTRTVLAWGKVLAIPHSGTGPSQFIGRKLGYMKYKIRLTAKLTPTIWYPLQLGNTGTTASSYVPLIIPTQVSFRVLIYQVKSGGSASVGGNETTTAPSTQTYHPMTLPDYSVTYSLAPDDQSSGIMVPGAGWNMTQVANSGPATWSNATGILSNVFQYTPTPASNTDLGSEYFQGTNLTDGVQNTELLGPTAQYTSLLRGQLRDGFTKSATVLYDKVFNLGTNNGRSQLQKKISIRPAPYRWQEAEGNELDPQFKMEDWPVNAIYMLIIPIFNHYTTASAPNAVTNYVSYGRLDLFGNSELVFTDP